MDTVDQYPILTVEKCRLSVERFRGALKLIVSMLVEWSHEGKLWCRMNELGRYRMIEAFVDITQLMVCKTIV